MSDAQGERFRISQRWPNTVTYGLACASVFSIAALKYSLQRWISLEEGVFLFFSGAAIGTALFGGFRPTLIATALGLIIGVYWSTLENGFGSEDLVRAIYFVVQAPIIGWGAQRIRELHAKEVEAQLERAAEQRGRALLEAAPDAMIVVNNKNQTVLVNAQAERMFGYHRQELLGRPIETLIPHRFHRNHQTYAQEFIQHPTARVMGGHSASALWGLRRDGSEFPVEVSLSPITSGGERLVASAIRDVTARRQSETRKEEQSEGRWKFLAGSVPSIVWTSNSDGVMTFMSSQWKELTGSPFLTEDAGYSWRLQLHPDDSTRVLEQWQRCVQTGVPFVSEYRIRRYDGMYRWFTGRAVPRRDASGEIAEWFGALTDIHELRGAQDRAEATLRHLSAIIDTAPIGILTIDDGGVVQSWNRAAESILGWTAEEVLGKRAPHIPESTFESGEWAALVKANASGTGLHGEECLRISKSGQPVPITLWTVAVLDGDRKLNLHMLLDAREKKKLEDQLRQAAKMEAIGRLAGGIAHDFNNLLQIINGYSRMLLDASSELSGEQQEFVTEIIQAGDRAAQLTADLLKFSRQQVVQPKVIDLNAEIDALRNMVGRLLTEGIRLDFTLSPEAGRIRIDRGQLSQIVINLCANARDAMPTGGRLMIETGAMASSEFFRAEHMQLKAGRYAYVAVTDTGYGMTAEVRERIFEPFFTTKKGGFSHTHGGTGLGLATVYGIVKQNEGEIYVYSEPDRGTTFKVYLPQYLEEGRADIPVEPPAVAGGSEHILVVEDEESVRRLIRTMFADWGYQLYDTGNTDVALEYARRHEGKIDLLLTDLVMPKCSGKELARAMVQMQPNMKVLFMSGFPGSAVVQQGMLDADMEFLAKPFSAEQLRLRVRSVLDSRKAVN